MDKMKVYNIPFHFCITNQTKKSFFLIISSVNCNRSKPHLDLVLIVNLISYLSPHTNAVIYLFWHIFSFCIKNSVSAFLFCLYVSPVKKTNGIVNKMSTASQCQHVMRGRIAVGRKINVVCE